jgi:hypothetical protein
MNSAAASSQSVSKRRPWIVLGNPDNRRVKLFQSALRESGRPAAHVVAYRDWLSGEVDLAETLARLAGEPCVLRIESPGEDFEVECRLIARGAAALEPGDNAALSRAAALRLRDDRGRVRTVRQWFAGFSALLDDVEQAIRVPNSIAGRPAVTVQNHPAAIRLLFDKPRCHRFLADRGVPVPPALQAQSLPAITSYDSLREAMRAAGWSRVFVKLAWGSSASGVVAFSTTGTRPLAITSLELVRRRGEARFYNNLRLSHYHRERDLRTIFDFLGREGVHVEQWLPKAMQGDRNFDLRVVTFAGKACHTVVRTSRTPLTNLHLGNRRGDLSLLRRSAGSRWKIVSELCEQAARELPDALYVGWDVLVTPGFRQAFILEGNAFGDLLPGLTHRGLSTYGRGIAAVLRRDGSGRAVRRCRPDDA